MNKVAADTGKRVGPIPVRVGAVTVLSNAQHSSFGEIWARKVDYSAEATQSQITLISSDINIIQSCKPNPIGNLGLQRWFVF